MKKTTKTEPKTLQQAIRYYSDEQTCIDSFAEVRWPDGKPECPRCNGKEHYYLATQKRWKCKACGKQFSVKVGTIFEDSPLGLDKWLMAVWMIGNCKNGVSSCEMAKDLGITQKSAWFMLHRIRLAMQTGSFMKLGGGESEVEVDETFIGGKARNMHVDVRERRITGTGGKDKTAVQGILERGGKVRTIVVANRRKKVLQDNVKAHVAAGTALYTDALLSYDGLSQEYGHQVIDHAEKYVEGRVHTNGLENFWSLLKRGLNGTYVSVEPFHLFRYLDEQSFRYNNRSTKYEQIDDAQRFKQVLSHCAGKRLTFAEVTGKAGKTTVN
jgi:transposase-like protein